MQPIIIFMYLMLFIVESMYLRLWIYLFVILFVHLIDFVYLIILFEHLINFMCLIVINFPNFKSHFFVIDTIKSEL